VSRWFVAGLLLLAGCPPSSGGVLTVVDERFEEPITTHWTVSGSVELVETYHPAEHGLRFLAATTMSRATLLTLDDEYDDGNWIEYSTSCTGMPEVWAEEIAPSNYQLHVAIPQEPDGTADEFQRVYLNTPPLARPQLGGGYDPVTISALVVEAYQGGSCVIDNLRLQRLAPEVW